MSDRETESVKHNGGESITDDFISGRGKSAVLSNKVHRSQTESSLRVENLERDTPKTSKIPEPPVLVEQEKQKANKRSKPSVAVRIWRGIFILIGILPLALFALLFLAMLYVEFQAQGRYIGQDYAFFGLSYIFGIGILAASLINLVGLPIFMWTQRSSLGRKGYIFSVLSLIISAVPVLYGLAIIGIYANEMRQVEPSDISIQQRQVEDSSDTEKSEDNVQEQSTDAIKDNSGSSDNGQSSPVGTEAESSLTQE